MATDERESKLKPAEEFSAPSLEATAEQEAKNAIAQFDLLVDMIDREVELGERFRLRPSILGKLNEAAVQGLVATAGATRTGEIEILGALHTPPPWREVQGHLEEMCDYVNDNWATKSALHLSAYIMWRLNWIHPYADGNGRTSRAASYLVLCVRTGYLLPGEVAIPEQIAANKRKYYRALEAADKTFADGSIDVGEMEALLHGYLATQLMQVIDKASGKDVERPVPPGRAWELD